MAGHDKHDDKNAKDGHAKPHAGGGAHGGDDHEEAHEGAPEWLISFADNTALMMGFFVILLAMNMAPKGSNASGSDGDGTGGPTAEQLDFALSVRDGFNNPVSIDSTDPRDALLVQRLRERRGQAQEQGARGEHDKVQSPEKGDHYNVSGVVTFEFKSEKLSSAGIDNVVEMAAKVRGLSNLVELRGYSDPFESDMPRGTLDLTYRRAMAVAVVLAQEGVEWDRIRLVAGGVYEGARDGYDEAVNDRARCVEMSLMEILAEPKPADAEQGDTGADPGGKNKADYLPVDPKSRDRHADEAKRNKIDSFHDGFQNH